MSVSSRGGLAAAALVAIGLQTPAVAAEEGTVKILAPWDSSGEVYRVAPDKVLFQGKAAGIMYIDGGEGPLDAALFTCPGRRELAVSEKTVQASGNCVIAVSDGDNVFAEFRCTGTVGACEGEFKLTGGTGKFKGITGSGPVMVRTVLAGMMLNMKSGSTVSGAAGLAVWPELKYTIPGN